MVIHVGIDISIEKVSIFDSETEEERSFQISPIDETSDYYIDEIFKNIKFKIKEKLGNVCICWPYDYDFVENSIRKNEVKNQFVQCGLNAGFLSVEIIIEYEAKLLEAISHSPCHIKNNDFVWIIDNQTWYAWQKINDQIKYITTAESIGNITKEHLGWKCKSSRGIPNVIFYCHRDKLVRFIIQRTFPNCQVFPVKFPCNIYSKWALSKARGLQNFSK